MTAGGPEGAVLGPTLWNILYDGVLTEDLGGNVMAVCFADGLGSETTEAVIFMGGRHTELKTSFLT